jgi:hypothetical protein
MKKKKEPEKVNWLDALQEIKENLEEKENNNLTKNQQIQWQEEQQMTAIETSSMQKSKD